MSAELATLPDLAPATSTGEPCHMWCRRCYPGFPEPGQTVTALCGHVETVQIILPNPTPAHPLCVVCDDLTHALCCPRCGDCP